MTRLCLAALLLLSPAPALAQDITDPPAAVTVGGGATLTTDYRYRGLSRSDEHVALQGTLNAAHESGFYVGAFASTIDGDGDVPLLTGYGDVEIDLYGGYAKTFASGVGVDVGLLYYWFADAAGGRDTDYFEPYAAVSYSLGPVATKAGVAYAWGGQDGLDRTGGSDDNLYAYLDASAGIPATPVTLKAHAGYSNGALGRVNPGASDDYWDWSIGGEYTRDPFRAGVSYVDTDVTNRAGYAQSLGRGATVLGFVGISF